MDNIVPRWRLSKESKLYMASDMKTPQNDLARLLKDEDPEVRFQAARHPGVNPNDMMQALAEYPELQTASIQNFLLWQYMQQQK